MEQKDLVAGYVADWSEYPLGEPVPLPNPLLPGISVQAVGTFSKQLTNLELEPLETLNAMAMELGIPRHALLCQVTLIEPFNQKGYTLEVVGTPIEPTDPPEAPRFVDMFSSKNPLTIVAWRRRVYCCGIDGYLEVLWHPERGETKPQIKELEDGITQESVLRLHRGLRLIKAITRHAVGRPPHSRFYSSATFHQEYPRVWAAAKRRRPPHPRDEDIARELGISLSTMRRYLRDYGRPVFPEPPAKAH